MPVREILSYLALWSTTGAVLFSLFVVYVFRSGLAYAARRRDGTLKEKIPLRGYVSMASFLLAVVGFFLAANYFGLARNAIRPGFWTLLALNYGLYLILFLFDTVFIDGIVLALWRPGFLRLPEEIGSESMRVHILRSLPVGLVFGALLAAVGTVFSHYVIMR
jgi:hypothetical protein